MAALMAVLLIRVLTVPVFAETNDPIEVVNNLSDFMFGLVRAVGMVMLGFAVVQIGLSLKSHDPSQRANGFLALAGGGRDHRACLHHLFALCRIPSYPIL